MNLSIWLGGEFVARAERQRKQRVVITYTDDVVDRFGDEVPLLSCSLPTPGPSSATSARAFLEGLLPEGRALETMAARVRGVRLHNGFPESAIDATLLLAEYGRECAGAVVIVPSGTEYDPGAGDYEAVDAIRLQQIVRDLPDAPLNVDVERELRMSLAGAQPKFLLARFEDTWYEPRGGSASTHILKPTSRWEGSARNEALVMAIAQAVGLTEVGCWVEDHGGVEVFVAERYDRRIVDGRVVRSHQEDVCQALGIRPADKYGLGRPSLKITPALRRLADDPANTVRGLYHQVVFRAIVGDEDGHGKNYSLLLDGGRVRLAPLYDCLCTLVYSDLTGRMALPLDQTENLRSVTKASIIREGMAMGIPEGEAEAMVDDLAARIDTALTGLPDALTHGPVAGSVADILRHRLRRLSEGKAMGPRARA